MSTKVGAKLSRERSVRRPGVLRQEIPRARADRDLIAAIDGAVDIYVGAEVRRVRRLTGAGARLQHISGVDKTIAVGVTKEKANAYCRVRQNLSEAVGHAAQGNCDCLHVGHAGQVHGHGIADEGGTSGDAACPGGHAGVAADEIVTRRKDQRMISTTRSAFDTGRAGER